MMETSYLSKILDSWERDLYLIKPQNEDPLSDRKFVGIGKYGIIYEGLDTDGTNFYVTDAEGLFWSIDRFRRI